MRLAEESVEFESPPVPASLSLCDDVSGGGMNTMVPLNKMLHLLNMISIISINGINIF